jgi:hypothetical protein
MLIPGLLLAFLYANPGWAGINTPEAWLQSRFSGHARTGHFDVYYDTTAVSPVVLDRILDEHEWHYERLRRLTGVQPSRRIASYVYPDNETRARLTGARTTSVAPVWLRNPQVHVSLASVLSVFPHELAHVFSREFGMPLIKASPWVGLVEGFAVATEPPSGGPSPEATVLATHPDASARMAAGENVARALSPLGFWGGRAGVSYTWTGAFVRHLVATRGMDAFRKVYRSGDFEAVYGQPVQQLMASWLRDMPEYHASLPADARVTGQRRFSVPSLFEQPCPHWVPRPVRAYRRAMAAADTSGLRQVWERWPGYQEARLGWASLALPDSVPSVLGVLTGVPADRRDASWYVLAGLAAVQKGDSAQGRDWLRRALEKTRISDRGIRMRTLTALDTATEGGLQGTLREEWIRLQHLEELIRLTMDGDLDRAAHVGHTLVRNSTSVGDFGIAALGQEWLDRIEWRRERLIPTQ